MTKLEAQKTLIKVRGDLYDLYNGQRLRRARIKAMDEDLIAVLIKLRDLPDDEVTA